jgi:uncharacterized protein YggT (Ycf19 family)
MRAALFPSMGTTYVDRRLVVSRRQDVMLRIAQALDFLFGLLYTLLAIRLLLELIRARRGAGFVEFIAALTDFFYAPFRGIVASDTIDGSHPIVWPIVIAIVAYMLLHGVIRRLLSIAARPAP